MPLTDTRVQTLTTGNQNERLIADTNGLYLRLRKGKGGITRTWQFCRRDGAKLSIVTLDTYPAHEDRTPSLCIRDGKRAVLLTCFAGCNRRDVLAEMRRLGLLEKAKRRAMVAASAAMDPAVSEGDQNLEIRVMVSPS